MAVRNSTPMSPAFTWMNTDEAATDGRRGSTWMNMYTDEAVPGSAGVRQGPPGFDSLRRHRLWVYYFV